MALRFHFRFRLGPFHEGYIGILHWWFPLYLYQAFKLIRCYNYRRLTNLEASRVDTCYRSTRVPGLRQNYNAVTFL